MQTAYLTASLLIDPESELTILLTATIQADLKSDNFLTICTALQAIPTVANPELINVFLPEVVGLVKHDRDAVKKRALTTLHSLLLVDPSIAGDVGKVFVDQLGYKEPAVMFAVLPALYDLIDRDPEPYKGLVHSLTNILKQASEGKLGRTWVTHRAPAPFLQITLLRILGRLGRGDPKVSTNMQSIVIDVWKRAESLMCQAGNAILFECMKLTTSIVPSDALCSMALDTAAIFLSSTDNNLKCCGIETLTKMIEDGDAAKVQQHQMAIVTALRSSDVTLKGRTLALLFRMARPSNIEVVYTEVLNYIKEDSIDDESRKYAASNLLQVMENYAPSLKWFIDSTTNLLQTAGMLAPAAAQSSLVRTLQRGDVMLQELTTKSYFDLIESNKMASVPLTKVACWCLGEFGLASGISFDVLCSTLTDILESRTKHSPDLAVMCILSLSKINMRASQPLPVETTSILKCLQQPADLSLSVQQAAFEASSISERDLSSKGLKQPCKPPKSLSFLDDIAAQAAADGSAPYIDRNERYSIGIERNSFNPASQVTTHLKYKAYERHERPGVEQAANIHKVEHATESDVDDLLGNMNIRDQNQRATGGNDEQIVEEGIQVNKSGARRWGPSAQSQPIHSPPAEAQRQFETEITSPSSMQPLALKTSISVDPEQEMLAASLFGSGTRDASGGGRAVTGQKSVQATSVTEPFDLLDISYDIPSTTGESCAVEKQNERSDLDELFALGGETRQPMGDSKENNPEDIFSLMDDSLPIPSMDMPSSRGETQTNSALGTNEHLFNQGQSKQHAVDDPFDGLL